MLRDNLGRRLTRLEHTEVLLHLLHTERLGYGEVVLLTRVILEVVEFGQERAGLDQLVAILHHRSAG